MASKIFELTNELISKGVELANKDSKIFDLTTKETMLTKELISKGVELTTRTARLLTNGEGKSADRRVEVQWI
jgi:hypothetical protein